MIQTGSTTTATSTATTSGGTLSGCLSWRSGSKIAKDLLRPDNGVLVVTIDEHEVHHLGVLLEQVFREYEIYTISIVHNPKGKSDANVSRVNEFALICVPKVEGKKGRRAVEVFGGLPPDEADAMVGKRTKEHAAQEGHRRGRRWRG